MATTLPRPAQAPRPPALRGVAAPAAHAWHRAPPARSLTQDLALPIAAAGAALLVTALVVTGGRAHPLFAPAAFTLLTAWVSTLARPVQVPGVILVGRLFLDGFVVHRMSDLGLRPDDLRALFVLALAGAAGAGCAAVVRAVASRRSAVHGADD